MKKLIFLLISTVLLSGCTLINARTEVEFGGNSLADLYAGIRQQKLPDAQLGIDYTYSLSDSETGAPVEKQADLNREYKAALYDLKANCEIPGTEKKILFKDTTAPVLSFSHLVTVIQGTSLAAGIELSDNHDTGIVPAITGIDPDTLGRYHATISAADCSGNAVCTDTEVLVVPAETENQSSYAECTLIPSQDAEPIEDLTAPQMEVYADTYQYLPGEELPDLAAGAWAYDAYDDHDLAIAIEGTYHLDRPGVYYLTYVAVDHAGNRSERDFTLEVMKENTVSALPQVYDSASLSASAADGDVLIAAAQAQLGSTAACTTVVANCLAAAGLDFWHGDYDLVSSSEMQVGDVMAFYSATGSYPYHVIMYIGNDQCINGNYNGVAQITSCSSSRAQYTEVRRYH